MKKELELLKKRLFVLQGIVHNLSNIASYDEITERFIVLADELAKQIASENILTQFEDFPWVIKANVSQPTYYQQVEIVGEWVTVARKGKTSTVNYKAYLKDFRPATEAEVIQHIEYLNGVNHPYLKKEVKKPVPVLGYAPIPPAPAKKSAEAEFYCVTLKQGRGCTKYHNSYELAEKEAIRLSKQENKKAYVLGVVGEIEVIPTTTYETKIQKF